MNWDMDGQLADEEAVIDQPGRRPRLSRPRPMVGSFTGD
jgi:hypothetical protein